MTGCSDTLSLLTTWGKEDAAHPRCGLGPELGSFLLAVPSTPVRAVFPACEEWSVTPQRVRLFIAFSVLGRQAQADLLLFP